MKHVMFDVDGTLIQSYGFDETCFVAAVKEVTGVDLVSDWETCVLAVAGFTVGEKLAWGKHIYIDDLVTNESHRSIGVGSFLISWFKV